MSLIDFCDLNIRFYKDVRVLNLRSFRVEESFGEWCRRFVFLVCFLGRKFRVKKERLLRREFSLI